LQNGFQELAFWFLAFVTVGGSLLVIHIRDMFRAALLLIMTFIAVAGLLVLLSAEFIAIVQVLIYGGAISILVIFAVMMTKDLTRANRSSPVQPIALTIGFLFFGTLLWCIVQAEWVLLPEPLPSEVQNVFTDTSVTLGRLLLGEFVLAFEIAGILLLAAIIGALALVREH
jgi:NADH-quinone oxidoreductase subunit J